MSSTTSLLSSGIGRSRRREGGYGQPWAAPRVTGRAASVHTTNRQRQRQWQHSSMCQKVTACIYLSFCAYFKPAPSSSGSCAPATSKPEPTHAGPGSIDKHQSKITTTRCEDEIQITYTHPGSIEPLQTRLLNGPPTTFAMGNYLRTGNIHVERLPPLLGADGLLRWQKPPPVASRQPRPGCSAQVLWHYTRPPEESPSSIQHKITYPAADRHGAPPRDIIDKRHTPTRGRHSQLDPRSEYQALSRLEGRSRQDRTKEMRTGQNRNSEVGTVGKSCHQPCPSRPEPYSATGKNVGWSLGRLSPVEGGSMPFRGHMAVP